MKPPAVSVVIPLHNKGTYVTDAIASALAQTVSDFEIIVVDDGSTDDGPIYVKKINDPRIVVVCQGNIGVAGARNRGMNEAHAEFVAFLDADDLWNSDHILYLLQLARHYPQAALFGNRFIAFSGTRPPVPRPAPVTDMLVDDYFSACATGTPLFFTSSCMARREIALAAGGFPAAHSRGEDLALWMKIAAAAPVAVSTYVGGFYRRASGTLTAKCVTEPDVSMTTIAELIKTHHEWPASRVNGAREFYNRIALAHAMDCGHAGNDEAAEKFLALSAGTIAHRKRRWQARLLIGTPRLLRGIVIRFLGLLRNLPSRPLQ